MGLWLIFSFLYRVYEVDHSQLKSTWIYNQQKSKLAVYFSRVWDMVNWKTWKITVDQSLYFFHTGKKQLNCEHFQSESQILCKSFSFEEKNHTHVHSTHIFDAYVWRKNEVCIKVQELKQMMHLRCDSCLYFRCMQNIRNVLFKWK